MIDPYFMSDENAMKTPSPFQGEGWGEGDSDENAAHPRNLQLVDRTRSFRRRQTDAELKLSQKLRDSQIAGAKFRRQYPVGPYTADFICVEAGLIIEVDGSQDDENEKDIARTEFLEKHGYKTLHFWNNDVLLNIQSVLHSIYETLTLTLSLEGRGSKESL